MKSRRWLGVRLLVGVWTITAMAAGALAQTGPLEQDRQNSSAAIGNDWARRVLKGGPSAGNAVRPASAAEPIAKYPLRQVAGELPLEEIPLPDPPYDGLRKGPGAMGNAEFVPPGTLSLGPGYPDCYGGCGDCGGYGGCGGGGGYTGWGGHHGSWLRDLSFFAGVHGFKGPVDEGVNGNFGFQEGVNIGVPLGISTWGFQAGMAAVHSNFEGDQVWGDFRLGDRDQIFFTAGLFYRARCGGLQWGVVFDLLHDTYFETSDLKQIRSETGYVFSGGCREIGYFGAYGVGGDQLGDREYDLQLDPTDMFAVYYRRYFSGGGDGRLWAGFSGRGDGLIGADLRAPLGRGWAIENRINYLIPKEGRNTGAQIEESWGLTIQLVWYAGQSAHCALKSQFRPLLDVADNSLFMVDRLGDDD